MARVHLVWDPSSQINWVQVSAENADFSAGPYKDVPRPASGERDVLLTGVPADGSLVVVGFQTPSDVLCTGRAHLAVSDCTVHIGGSATSLFVGDSLDFGASPAGSIAAPFTGGTLAVWGVDAAGDMVLFDQSQFHCWSSDNGIVDVVEGTMGWSANPIAAGDATLFGQIGNSGPVASKVVHSDGSPFSKGS